jgi:2-oxoglutarate ferredoxin oxidoreductase subunit delta
MKQEPTSTLGAMISIEHPESCIGCNDCELSCPDFAICVADKKSDGFKFAKLTDESKARQVVISENNYRLPENYGK